MTTGILQHTPFWVWPLLAGLTALGLAQTMPRRMTPARATGVPVAMALLSLGGVISVFSRQPLALLAWVVAAAIAVAVSGAVGAWRGIDWSAADRRLLVPGSWMPLALILYLFAIRFAVGATQALNPEILHRSSIAMAVSFIYGTVSGIFLARSLVTWRLTRQAEGYGMPG